MRCSSHAAACLADLMSAAMRFAAEIASRSCLLDGSSQGRSRHTCVSHMCSLLSRTSASLTFQGMTSQPSLTHSQGRTASAATSWDQSLKPPSRFSVRSSVTAPPHGPLGGSLGSRDSSSVKYSGVIPSLLRSQMPCPADTADPSPARASAIETASPDLLVANIPACKHRMHGGRRRRLQQECRQAAAD